MTTSNIGAAPEWVEQYVTLAAIIKHPPFQIRKRLDTGAVKRYRGRSQAGSIAPPIKLGLIGEAHYLLDGWHRMDAQALTMDGDASRSGVDQRAASGRLSVA